jgi:hypothetical protein
VCTNNSSTRPDLVAEIDVWCMSCERAYKRHEYVLDNGVRRCPYECGASVEASQWDWSDLRMNHAHYPAKPEPGRVYHFFPAR